MGSESWRCCCLEISFKGMVLVHFLVDMGNSRDNYTSRVVSDNSQVHHKVEPPVDHSKVGVKTLNGTTAIYYNLFLCFEDKIL